MWTNAQAQSFMVHPAAFSYAHEASIKGPAENDVINLLVDEILQDGFVTSGEPLLLLQTDALMNGHPEVAWIHSFIFLLSHRPKNHNILFGPPQIVANEISLYLKEGILNISHG